MLARETRQRFKYASLSWSCRVVVERHVGQLAPAEAAPVIIDGTATGVR